MTTPGKKIHPLLHGCSTKTKEKIHPSTMLLEKDLEQLFLCTQCAMILRRNQVSVRCWFALHINNTSTIEYLEISRFQGYVSNRNVIVQAWCPFTSKMTTSCTYILCGVSTRQHSVFIYRTPEIGIHLMYQHGIICARYSVLIVNESW